MCKGLKEKVETKMTMVGEDDDLAKEARVLNRIVRWHPRERSSHEADSGHTKTIRRDTGAEKRETISSQHWARKERDARQRRRRDKI